MLLGVGEGDDYELGGSGGSDVFDAGHRELRAGHAAPGRAAARSDGSEASWSSTGRFVSLGLEHILGGIDHVLFLVLLLLCGEGWRASSASPPASPWPTA
ncbi:HupE/UreJ family protein [Streptomyces sp. NPDC093089]|uniref:HupE/UreJ family protein n=1 Tax=Streptomyces sp. NPDC093089 TaxID=3366024 RepID=UPI0037FC1AA6